ncbi:hypothetical protein [Glutamicibacter arilaitensis]|uniref:hypothetical protein n=1 Tax=Glutamicibacter arilaitensis TaxID=256701 RepID=UPI003FD678C6
MLYSFKLTTEPLVKNTVLTVADGEEKYDFIARKGQRKHFYTNIPLSNVPTIEFEPDHTFEQLSAGGQLFLTESQTSANRGIIRDRNVRYQVSVKGHPKRAIITFPAGKGAGGWEIPYPILSANSIDVDNAVYISFQDSYLTAGSYFICDNYGNSPSDTVQDIILRTLDKYRVPRERSYFLGSGKGANTAVIISSGFESNKLILLGYQLDLAKWIKSSHHAHLAKSLRRFGIPIPDAEKLLQEEAWRKETHYFSESDTVSEFGDSNLPFDTPNLYFQSSKHSVSEMLNQELDLIKEIIKES